MRTVATARLVNSYDVIWNIPATLIWPVIEVSLTIIAGSVPALKPLYSKFVGKASSLLSGYTRKSATPIDSSITSSLKAGSVTRSLKVSRSLDFFHSRSNRKMETKLPSHVVLPLHRIDEHPMILRSDTISLDSSDPMSRETSEELNAMQPANRFETTYTARSLLSLSDVGNQHPALAHKRSQSNVNKSLPPYPFDGSSIPVSSSSPRQQKTRSRSLSIIPKDAETRAGATRSPEASFSPLGSHSPDASFIRPRNTTSPIPHTSRRPPSASSNRTTISTSRVNTPSPSKHLSTISSSNPPSSSLSSSFPLPPRPQRPTSPPTLLTDRTQKQNRRSQNHYLQAQSQSSEPSSLRQQSEEENSPFHSAEERLELIEQRLVRLRKESDVKREEFLRNLDLKGQVAAVANDENAIIEDEEGRRRQD